MPPSISFIIPAYNEEALIGKTVQALHDATIDLAISFEIIVVDDASDDHTAQIAEQHGARIVHVNKRQIAATRNAGAAAAMGDILIFVDADTIVPWSTIAAALAVLEDGAVGGGATARFRGRVPIASRVFFTIMQYPMRAVGTCGGCFMFMTRKAYEQAGGYDERIFASEEVWLARALAKCGRFAVLPELTYTSGRKVRMYSLPRLLALCLQIAITGVDKREGLDVWYDGRRETAGADD